MSRSIDMCGTLTMWISRNVIFLFFFLICMENVSKKAKISYFFVWITSHIARGTFKGNIWHVTYGFLRSYFQNVSVVVDTALSTSTAIHCDCLPLITLIIRVIYRSSWLICYYLPMKLHSKKIIYFSVLTFSASWQIACKLTNTENRVCFIHFANISTTSKRQ